MDLLHRTYAAAELEGPVKPFSSLLPPAEPSVIQSQPRALPPTPLQSLLASDEKRHQDLPERPSVEEPLPPGWIQRRDQRTGRTFFAK